MKKIVSLVLIAVFVLVGCQSAKESTTVCELGMEGYKSTSTLVAKGDKILSLVEESTMDLSNIPEDQMETFLSSMESSFKGIKGITHTYTVEGKLLSQKTEYDFNTIDVGVLKSMGFITDDVKAEHLSLKQTKENFNLMGATCDPK